MSPRTFASSLSCALIAAMFSGCGGPSAPPISLQAPKNAIALIVIQSEALQKNPDLKPLIDLGEKMNPAKQEFDPKLISEVQIAVVPKPAGDRTREPIHACILIKFKDKVDEKVLKQMQEGLVEAEHKGKKYQTDRGNIRPAVFQLDTKTIVLGHEAAVKGFLEDSTAPPALAEAINRSSLKGQIRAAYAPGAEKNEAENLKKGMPPGTPMQIVRLFDLPKHVNLVALSMHVSGDEFLRVEVDTPGGDSPKEVKERLEGGLEFAKMTVTALLAFQLPSAPVPQDVKELAEPFLDQTLGKLKVTAEGSRVVVALPVSPELAKLCRDNTNKLVKAFEDAKRQQDTARDRFLASNKLKQIVLGAMNYETVSRQFPDDIRDASGKSILSWRVALLPYAEEQILFQQFDQKSPWDSARNSPLGSKLPFVYDLDRKAKGNSIALTRVFRFVGPGTLYDGKKPPKFADIRDGTSKTIHFVLAGPSKAVPWTQPTDLPFDPANPIAALGDIGPEGFQAAFFDGSVHRIPRDIDPKTLAALITPAGGEPIDWSQLDKANAIPQF